MNLRDAHAAIHADATRLAGQPQDLMQRASVYWHLYRHSGGNHGFPLLAAHGALWGAGHFRRGQWLSRVVTWLARLPDETRRTQLAKVDAFAHALKDINRRVCVETFTAYHLTRRFGAASGLSDVIPAKLVGALDRCHHARRTGQMLDHDQRRDLFHTIFLWEQDAIVGPAVAEAVATLDWPPIRYLSLRPPIGFSYFPAGKWLWFRAFDDTDERIRRGSEAFDLAERLGWRGVEDRLSRYGLVPADTIASPDTAFRRLARHLHVGAYAIA